MTMQKPRSKREPQKGKEQKRNRKGRRKSSMTQQNFKSMIL
jgi:hypothetical protein